MLTSTHRSAHRCWSLSGVVLLVQSSRAHQSRYTHRRRNTSILDQVLHRASLAVYHKQLTVHFAPRLPVDLRILLRATQFSHTDRKLSRQEATSCVRSDVMQLIKRTYVQTDRLIQQYRRVDEWEHRSTRPSALVEGRTRFRRLNNTQTRVIAMVLKREPGSKTAVHQQMTESSTPEKTFVVGRDEKGSTHFPPFAEIGPNELKRITDHVVNNLDQRVIAMRERLARI